MTAQESSSASAQLDMLEQEAIYIIRELSASTRNPALLFSGGKDSVVLFHLAQKAFRLPGRPLRLPFTLVHIDTGHNYPEVLRFRDETIARTGVKSVIGAVEESIRRGTVRLRTPLESRNAHQAVTLLETIEAQGFDALMGGARRDEEKARAKERIFSFRDDFGQWNPKDQRPELWDIYNARLNPGEHMRVFPISNWTELDIWQYIQREALPLPSIYFAHRRPVVERGDLLVPVTELTPARDGETVVERSVRFRTVGDITCTCPVASAAVSVADIIAETATATVSERSATRMDDRTDAASMEKRKRAGYF